MPEITLSSRVGKLSMIIDGKVWDFVAGETYSVSDTIAKICLERVIPASGVPMFSMVKARPVQLAESEDAPLEVQTVLGPMPPPDMGQQRLFNL